MSVNMNVTVPTGFIAVLIVDCSSVMLLLRFRPQSIGQPSQDRKRQRRVGEDGRLEVPAGEGEATRRLDCHDLGNARLPVEDRELAEELAGSEDGQLFTVADHPDPAVDHDEEARSDLALPDDDPIGGKIDLDRSFREVDQIDPSDAHEQPAGGQQLGSQILAD
jgi:hypothetical protein